ncbi:MAG: SMP-30/gluconolactonase/LRE family protein [Flavobacteriales bacterium]|jgi:hypothetical protein|nr:SMP-30/gluconolactonase/LRE family protein [Flavobacteriales bacterium]MBK7248514.1 SMP-30/gluconolactonase/LRE family protein [Flavobacteriales bacterium]MBK9597801.1 SMP-30/gluconolactonase/LRE family protein [Flavobacteriales bacterium]QQS73764.1 MAG: SMP-30/gluconolactonase/LRE family protein [Flavobacteriales bacterium]HQV39051.1 SMP-30/gluconolactonase/LRE family protein [Flavobacteriales bacterium]
MKIFYPALLLVSCSANAQYSGPESVEHDAEGQRYFVSNTGDNSIKQRAYDGTVTAFASNLPTAPYGIELKGDTLFACMGGSIRGFSTVDGVVVFSLSVGGSFLNGITTDGAFLYATDFSTKKIFKVNVEQLTYTTLVANTVNTPNGIVWDPALERLWVVGWGSNAKIKSYDRDSGAELSSYTTNLGSIDGVTLDCQGRIIVASWEPDQLTRYENTFTEAPVVLMMDNGLDHPADLDYDTVHDRVCVPNSGNNTVSLVDVADCTTAVPEAAPYGTFMVWPNPTNGLLKLDLELKHAVPFLVFNVRGTLVASGTLSPNGLLDITELASGTYVVDVPVLRKKAVIIRR